MANTPASNTVNIAGLVQDKARADALLLAIPTRSRNAVNIVTSVSMGKDYLIG